jgi:hypothetical protein
LGIHWVFGYLVIGYFCSAWVISAARAEAPKATHEVPYRLADTKHLLVRAKINGQGPFTFILDTGSPVLFVNKSVADKLGLKADADGWASFQRFELEGGLAVPRARARIETVAPVEAINGLGLAGTELHGLLGYNILAQYRIELDLTRDAMRWTPLDYRPDLPRIGQGGMPASINALGSLMKVFGVLLGRRSQVPLVPRGFLGIELEVAADKVVVKSVLADGPAGRAGLAAGDRITHFQNKALQKPGDLDWRASVLKPGDTVRLKVRGQQGEKEITFQAGEGL